MRFDPVRLFSTILQSVRHPPPPNKKKPRILLHHLRELHSLREYMTKSDDDMLLLNCSNAWRHYQSLNVNKITPSFYYSFEHECQINILMIVETWSFRTPPARSKGGYLDFTGVSLPPFSFLTGEWTDTINQKHISSMRETSGVGHTD